MRKTQSAYPLAWRMMDGLERVAAALWPARFGKALPYLMLLPALLLVGVLVLGLIEIGDTSLRTLDTSTFLMSETYTLANYQRALTESFFATVAGRSLMGSVIVTIVTLVFAFPYAYLMVRTQSSALRKLLLVALFLPFFIGQVVRAYGWLIILGNQGMVNEALGLVGVPPVRLLYNYPAVLFGLVQYMLPFAVLMLAPALTAIPEELESAAASLGAGWVRTFRYIVLPLARPGLVGAGLVVMTLRSPTSPFPPFSAAARRISSPTPSTTSSSAPPTRAWGRPCRCCSSRSAPCWSASSSCSSGPARWR